MKVSVNKYGIVLPSWAYSAERANLIRQTMLSLEKTEWVVRKPKLLLILKLTEHYPHSYITDELLANFDAEAIADPPGVHGTEQTLAYGTQYLFDQGVDYVTWMGDDALFHSHWHLHLRKLIEDKPDALGWSVYRSAYETYHTTLETQNGYVRVSTLCGHGMTVSRAEWEKWGINWRQGVWMSHGADTLDLYHATVREGERWTTAVSYVEHTGRSGMHCSPGIPEWAVDFQRD